MRRWALVALMLVMSIGVAQAHPRHAMASVTTKRVAVMLVNYSNDNRQPWTTQFISDRYNGPAPSVKDYYNQVSWGQLSVSADVYGWYPLAVSNANGCQQGVLASQADAAATAAGVNLSNYDIKVYIFPYTTACSFAGNGQLGGPLIWINMTPESCNTTNLCKQSMHVFIHEFGHTLGLSHANTDRCTENGVVVTMSATCTTQEAQDFYDVMGYSGNPGWFLSNLSRAELGWIPTSQVVTVTSNSTITVTPTNTQSSLVYRVPDGTGQFYYLENRAQTTVPYEYPPGGFVGGALLVRRGPELGPNLLCGSPVQLRCWNFTHLLNGLGTQNRLAVGTGFSYNGVTITNTAWDGTNNTVQVSYG